MAISHIYNQTFQGPVGTSNTVDQIFSGSGECNYENAALAIGTNFEILDMVFPASGLGQFSALWIPQTTGNMTCKINSSGSPDETITFIAGVPYIWNVNCGFANPFSNPVVSMFLTNAAAGSLTMAAVYTNPA